MTSINFTKVRLQRIHKEMNNYNETARHIGINFAISAAQEEGGFKNLFRTATAIQKKKDDIESYFRAHSSVRNSLIITEFSRIFIDNNYLINKKNSRIFINSPLVDQDNMHENMLFDAYCKTCVELKIVVKDGSNSEFIQKLLKLCCEQIIILNENADRKDKNVRLFLQKLALIQNILIKKSNNLDNLGS